MADMYIETAPAPLTPIDSQEPIQSQYAASPRIQALLQAMAARIDNLPDIELFYNKIFNPQTAEGAGLDIWGRIVAIGRDIKITNTEFFGFSGSDLFPFNNAPFWNDAGEGGVFQMDDIAYRVMVFYKAMANIGDETLYSINTLLNTLFKALHGQDAEVYAQETGDMEITVTFLFRLTPFERAVFLQFGLLTRGGGVSFHFREVDPNTGNPFE